MTEEEETSWSKMIPDLLESISDRLSLQDYLVFCCVCRHWRFAPSYRSNLIYFRQNKPWLMFYGFDNNYTDKCYFYSHSYTQSCQVRVPHLQGATCVDSKSGWLLARRNRHFFFCNPFSGTKIDLPEYPQAEAAECVGTFTLLPTSPYCKIFILSRKNVWTIEIGSCLVGDQKWDIQDIEESEAELGTMRFATYCCHNGTCHSDGDHSVSISASKLDLIYGLSDKLHVTSEHAYREGSGSIPTYYKELKALHYVDWLDKFGENGISISTSALELQSNAIAGYCSCEIHVDGKANTGRRIVKAVGVEPLLKRC